MNEVTVGEDGYELPRTKLSHSFAMVIPAFNEEHNIRPVVERSRAILARITDRFEILVIDDASTDGTSRVLGDLAARVPELTVLTNEHRIGCHPSEYKGLLATRSDWAFFIPSDLQIVPEELLKFLPHLGAFDMIFGHRKRRKDGLFRVALSGLYNHINRRLFDIPIKDIDSVVVFSRRVIEAVVPGLSPNSAFSNIEMIESAKEHGFALGEIDIQHFPRRSGRAKGVNLRDLTRVPVELVAHVATHTQRRARRARERSAR